MDIIDYKWKTFAQRVHRTGLTAHVLYVFLLILYIKEMYLQIESRDEDGKVINPPPHVWYLYMISGCLVYPLIYDGNQLVMQGIQEYS
jgi:hypothetical protein